MDTPESKFRRALWLAGNAAIILLAAWGAAVLLALLLYRTGWLPPRAQQSLQTGVRMMRSDWHHRGDDGRRLPRGAPAR